MKMSIESIRKAVKRMIKEMKPEYHLTLTFPKGITESEGMELLNLFTRKVNRKFFRESYKKMKHSMGGVAIREFSYYMGTPHFHMVISGFGNTKSRLLKIIKSVVKYIRKISGKNRSYIADFKLQDYTDARLEDYLTKQFRFESYDKAFDSIGILGFGDVAFGKSVFGEQKYY